MNPLQLGSSMTGLPVKTAKKPTRRGRRPSSKPGADHLAKLQAAHGKGDHKAARRHALDYAKATSQAESMDNDGPVGAPEENDAPRGAMNANGTPPALPVKAAVNKAALASLALKRKK